MRPEVGPGECRGGTEEESTLRPVSPRPPAPAELERCEGGPRPPPRPPFLLPLLGGVPRGPVGVPTGEAAMGEGSGVHM